MLLDLGFNKVTPYIRIGFLPLSLAIHNLQRFFFLFCLVHSVAQVALHYWMSFVPASTHDPQEMHRMSIATFCC
ncbi:hypothetical protein PCASD_00869 [Puccinia coronata f. sp. avenae]|uniref:Uncharacterized protein n=1 Tax=Puccinia coronata f. sp. avenae TaxID=200324 RepID=A0A2N5VPK6_9BASI|nr:hypothetical protein PCASD_00869 [Puccinia coronata f. sp. avenae]